jgi:hypothetical protein
MSTLHARWTTLHAIDAETMLQHLMAAAATETTTVEARTGMPSA